MTRALPDICKEKELSMLELADRCGLDLPRVRAIFLGRWTPSPQERAQIATALDLAADEIAWGHSTPIQHLYGHGPG